jgi:hypothetical protein
VRQFVCDITHSRLTAPLTTLAYTDLTAVERSASKASVAPPSTTRATGRAEAVDLKPTLSLVGCNAASQDAAASQRAILDQVCRRVVAPMHRPRCVPGTTSVRI